MLPNLTVGAYVCSDGTGSTAWENVENYVDVNGAVVDDQIDKHARLPHPGHYQRQSYSTLFLRVFWVALSFSFCWGVGEGYFSPWPNTCIAASCKFLNISPTLFPSLSPHYDTGRVPMYDRLHVSQNTKPPNGALPSISSDLTQASITIKLNKSTAPWLPVALSTPPPFERNGGGDVWARGTKERDTAFWRG